jgi:4,5-epoxidase
MDAVLVAGAGPTGLVLACGLAAAGVPVRVIDRADGPATSSRALGLQPRGAEVVERAGALGNLPERSVRIGEIRVNAHGRLLASLKVGMPTKLVTRPGLLMSQAEIEGRLRNRLADLGVKPEWGTELTGLDQDERGVTVRLSTGERAGAAWLAGCDGAHSGVRKAAGIAFTGVPLLERFLLADVHASLPFPRTAVSVWLDGDAMIAAFPLPGGDLWRLMAPAPAPAPERSTKDIPAALAAELERQSGIPASAVRSAEWASSFQIHRRLASSYRSGRVLLAGDAAHIHSPLGGQGLNTGIGDAENLAFKLALVASGRASAALLDSYEAERRPVASEVLSSTSGLTQLMLGDNPIARVVRDRVAVPLLNTAWVRRTIWEQSSQLKVSYRRGPLGAPRAWLSGGPRPGDRVASIPCRRADGTPTALHAELGHRWALLTTEPGYEAAARARLGDLVTVLVPERAPVRGAVLVRPDAHAGFCGTGPDALGRWLDDALERGRAR